MPWLTEWQYRKSHEIIGSPTEAQTDYQVWCNMDASTLTFKYFHTIFSFGVEIE